MCWRLRVDIKEREAFLVLIYRFSRDGSIDNFAEKAVHIGISLQERHRRDGMLADPFLVLFCETMQAFTHVPEGAAVVVCSFPDRAFVFGEGFAFCGGQVVEPVILRVDGVLLDKAPLLKKALKVDWVLLAVSIVHQQQRIEPFDLYPPLL